MKSALRIALPWVLVALGAAGLAVLRARQPAVQQATGAFWDATNAKGVTLTMSGRDAGLKLAPSDTLRLRDSEDELQHLESIEVVAQATVKGAMLEVTLREQAGRSYAVVAVPGEPFGVRFTYREQGSEPVVLQRAQLPGILGGNTGQPADSFRLRITAAQDAFAVALNGREALSCRDQRLPTGSTSVLARKGPCNLLSLSVTGTRTTQLGKTESFSSEETFLPPAARRMWGRHVGSLGIALGALALFTLYLRALCLGRPPTGRLLRAGGVGLAPVALPFAAELFVRVPTLLTAAAVLTAVGLVLGLAVLRPHLRAPEPRSAWGRLLGVGVVLALVILAGRSILLRHEAALGTLLADERASESLPAPPDYALEQPLHLDAGNALVIPGPYRDLRLRAEVTLAADALLELRLRAAPPPVSRGVALWLPSDPRLQSSFVLQGLDFGRVGSAAPSVAAGQPIVLEVLVRGREFEVEVNGQRLDATVLEHATGGIVLLAARGSLDVASLTVQPVPAGKAPGPPWTLWARAALTPAAIVLLFAALAAVLLRLPFARVAEACAFALIPIAVGFGASASAGGLTPNTVMQISFGVVLLLVVPCCVHTRALTPLRGLLLQLAVLAAAPAAVALAGPSLLWPPSLSWRGERLEDDLAWLQYPMLRNFNFYLGDHRFRGRASTLHKPADTLRVVTLGGSSTWGFAIPEGSGKEYPMVLERLLNQQEPGAPPGRRVEVINGAILAATGERQFRFLRDALLAFEPDVVALSIRYNDCLTLDFDDEAEFMQRICAPDFRRSLLGDLVIARRDSRAKRQLNQLTGAWRNWHRSSLELWNRMGFRPGQPTPPERFEALLRRFAELARERGFRLVLIKEPVRDRHTLWWAEFGAVFDKVGAEYGVPVVDPTPALDAAGGAWLFMDVVHLHPKGLQVVAEELAPVVRTLLDR